MENKLEIWDKVVNLQTILMKWRDNPGITESEFQKDKTKTIKYQRIIRNPQYETRTFILRGTTNHQAGWLKNDQQLIVYVYIYFNGFFFWGGAEGWGKKARIYKTRVTLSYYSWVMAIWGSIIILLLLVVYEIFPKKCFKEKLPKTSWLNFRILLRQTTYTAIPECLMP